MFELYCHDEKEELISVYVVSVIVGLSKVGVSGNCSYKTKSYVHCNLNLRSLSYKNNVIHHELYNCAFGIRQTTKPLNLNQKLSQIEISTLNQYLFRCALVCGSVVCATDFYVLHSLVYNIPSCVSASSSS